MPYVDTAEREATPAIAEGLYLIARLLWNMQTGTTPARRIVTEPASGRSAPPTGACQRLYAAETADSGGIA